MGPAKILYGRFLKAQMGTTKLGPVKEMRIYINIIARPTGKMLLRKYIDIKDSNNFEAEALRLVEEKYPEIFNNPISVTFEKYKGLDYEPL